MEMPIRLWQVAPRRPALLADAEFLRTFDATRGWGRMANGLNVMSVRI